MRIKDYYDVAEGQLSFTREQGSQFAKQVADDFNPLHDVDNKRFCVPGDLMFSVILARYGLSRHMECTFSGMVGAGLGLLLPEAGAELPLCDADGRQYLKVVRSGDNTDNAELIQQFSQEYVRYSGHTFPDLLVPIMAEHGVMINPQRPMVMYQSMTVDFDTLALSSPKVHATDSQLTIEGKRGLVDFGFVFTQDDTEVGRGRKQMLLSGLRPYDEAGMLSLVDTHRQRKQRFAQSQP